jgi:hypothetical protein
LQPHTVTQSSQLSICNASQQAGAFKSGMQQAGFQMPLTVNDSSTIFYYCAVPNHCQKGMVRPLSLIVARATADLIRIDSRSLA